MASELQKQGQEWRRKHEAFRAELSSLGWREENRHYGREFETFYLGEGLVIKTHSEGGRAETRVFLSQMPKELDHSGLQRFAPVPEEDIIPMILRSKGQSPKEMTEYERVLLIARNAPLVRDYLTNPKIQAQMISDHVEVQENTVKFLERASGNSATYSKKTLSAMKNAVNSLLRKVQ